MKRIFTLIGFIFLIGITASAQQPRDGERIQALKIAYITKKLNLTTDEAQRFWPVYNQYVSEMRKVRFEGREDDEIEKDEKVLAIKKKYQGDFSKALSPERANQFFKAEKEFNAFVAKELQERRMNNNRKDKNQGNY
jgi:hypothetical protein